VAATRQRKKRASRLSGAEEIKNGRQHQRRSRIKRQRIEEERHQQRVSSCASQRNAQAARAASLGKNGWAAIGSGASWRRESKRQRRSGGENGGVSVSEKLSRR